MGRARKFVRYKGKIVKGLSLHKASGRYYSIPDGKARKYWGSELDAAAQDYRASKLSPEDRERAELMDKVETLEAEGVVLLATLRSTLDTIDGGPKPEPKPEPKPVPASKETLADCLSLWEEWKQAESCTAEYIAAGAKIFREFLACVGNLPISQVTHGHFGKWQRRIIKAGRNESHYWQDRRHKIVSQILKFAVRKRQEDWAFPPRLSAWADSYDRKAWCVDDSNALPLPVEDFQAILQALEYSTTETPTIKRAMLYIAIQTGFVPTDLAALNWDNLHLSEPTPYVDLPRTKVEKKTGAAVPRITPLLPQTVRALVALERGGAWVFSGRRKRLTTAAIKQQTNKLFRRAGVTDFTIKHLRNVGANLAEENDLSELMISRFLGHTVKSVKRHYLAKSKKPEYLLPLVALIERDYFPKPEALVEVG